ncbi:MAG: hypothetical protein HY067_17375 [Betaproteobacteria bacterium]|nr:hypothetical protein [Betaproteobacteria bacterium]
MRYLTEFSAIEWLKLLPVQHALKQIRNDAWLALYKNNRPNKLSQFLAEYEDLADKNIALVIAFEQPWALNWLLQMANRNVSDMTVLVFDNSRNNSKRIEIEQICKQNKAPYLALPPNPTRHVNRSHGMAMTWVYHNVVRAINPRIFGFIDHDLIPVRKVSIADKLTNQPVYGLLNRGKFGFWYLWAGYCFFDYAGTKDKSINFLYDFSRDLDTGGRNWKSLYRDLDPRQLRVVSAESISMKVASIENPRLVQFVDKHWLHIGGISYNFPEHIEFFKDLENVLNEGSS